MNNVAEPERALAPEFYTDPEIYAREQRGLMARTWQFAGHVSQVREAGDYFEFTIAGESLFCVRGQDGVLRGFYNVCQHRAHQLVKGSGNCRLVVCPYHAWTYQLDGRLRSGPNVQSVPGFDRDSIRLTEVRIEELHGFIFANLDPEASPMAQWFPGVADELGEFVPQIAELAPVQWVEIPEECNWKVSVENYSECYHCSLNHKSFTTGVIKAETYDIQPRGYCLRHTTESQQLEQMSYEIDLTANEHAGEYRSWYLWPMFSFQVYPGNVLNTYHWRPRGVDAVTVWRGWYTVHGAEDAAIAKLAKQDRETTVAEDILLVESVQQGLRSRGYRPGPLVLDPQCGLNSEHSLRALHGWIREAVANETQSV